MTKRGSGKAPVKGPVGKPGSWRGRIALVVLVVVVGAGAWVAWRHFARGRDQGIRNVVLISIDTCRADRLGCYGFNRPTTPNVDALAREGVLFQNVLTPVPMTTPAHSSMFTGTYPPTHGVRMNNGQRLTESSVTLASVLRKGGFRTAAFVGGFPLDAQFGLNQGFDTYDCQFSRTNERSKTIGERTAEEVNRPALAWLEENVGKSAGEKPFFLFLHYFDAHAPYEPPASYAKDFADDLYSGEIAYVDHCIGQVVDRLRAKGAYDNTLVIVTADHGEGLGEHGERAHAFFIYESTTRVPLVVRLPQGSGGLRVSGNVSLVDIVPTVLDLVGLASPPQVQGVSLRGALGGGQVPTRKQPIYVESLEAASFGCSPLNGVVESVWKYIRAPRQELYDRKNDPLERSNAVESEPAVGRRMRNRLEGMLQEMESAAPRRGSSTVDPEALKKLQGLGYMGAAAATPPSSAFDPTMEDPKDFQPTYELLQKANGLFLSNQIAQAKTELLAIAAARPKLVTAQALLAQIAVNERRLGDAVGYCETIVSILTQERSTSRPAPVDSEDVVLGTLDTRNLATAHGNLAVVLKEMGKAPEAISQFEQALRTAPNSAEIHFNLGVVLAQAGKMPEAAAQYEEALRLRPEYADAHLNLAAAMLRAGKLPEAIGHYEQVLRIRPEQAKTDPNFTASLTAARKAAAVLDQCEQALRARPDDAQAHNNLGGVLRQIGRVDEAIGHFEQALRIKPDYAEAHYNLGLALLQTGKESEAAGQYTEALRTRPDFVLALNNLAWLRATHAEAKLRDGAEAVRLAEQACQLTHRKEWGILDTLAAAYAEAGRFPEAAAAAQEAEAMARSAGQAAAAEGIQSRAALYKSARPYHEPPRKSP